jgi:hypothetical protein
MECLDFLKNMKTFDENLKRLKDEEWNNLYN